MSSRRAAREGLALPAQRRLRLKSQFEAVYARGRRFGDGFFGMIAHANDAERPRLGLAVATQVAGNSVQRNRIRRIIRESFRLHQHAMPPVDVVVSARTPVRTATNAELRASLDVLWEQVTQRCASLPRP